MDNQKIIAIGVIVVVFIVIVFMMQKNNESFDPEEVRAKMEFHRDRQDAMMERIGEMKDARFEDEEIDEIPINTSITSTTPRKRRRRLFRLRPRRRFNNAIRIPVQENGWVYMRNEPESIYGGRCLSVDCPEKFRDRINCWHCHERRGKGLGLGLGQEQGLGLGQGQGLGLGLGQGQK